MPAEDADDIDLGEETAEPDTNADEELEDVKYYEQEVGNKPDRGAVTFSLYFT